MALKTEFSRSISAKFDIWKTNFSDKILFVQGARKVGKTHEIMKFAHKKFKKVHYINLSSDSTIIDAAEKGHTYFEKFLKELSNSTDSVIVIDEVQLSKKLYNMLQVHHICTKSPIIITGSYTGLLLNNNTDTGLSDNYRVTLHTLSFEEFCNALKVKYEQGDDAIEAYALYRQIGGYPEVVKTYIKTHDISLCLDVIEQIWLTYCEESLPYFNKPSSTEILNECLYHVIRSAVIEKKGMKKCFSDKEVTKLHDRLSGRATISSDGLRETIQKAINWLELTGVIGVCNVNTTGKLIDGTSKQRYYIRDIGIANYIYSLGYLPPTLKEGFITECFAYNELRICNKTMSVKVPTSSTVNNYELDFIYVDRELGQTVGLEIKTANGRAASLRYFTENNLIDIAVKAGMMRISIDEKGLISYPIYLVGKLDVGNIISNKDKLLFERTPKPPVTFKEKKSTEHKG